VFKRISQKKIQLTKNLHINYKGIRVTLPKGFITDGASIPKIFWWLGKPFSGDTLYPSFIHDYLYNQTTIPRLIADLIFLDMMKENGVGFIKRWVYFKVVVLCGWMLRIAK
jgi:hypothetical protein